jgi:transposase
MEGYYIAPETARLNWAGRKRALGGGRHPKLNVCDQLLVTVVWLRVYPTQAVLGYLFGVSATNVLRTVERWLPMLEQAGRDTMRLPRASRKRLRQLDDLLREIPELAVVIDTFEQRVQRPANRTEADGLYSGKKKMHTLKSQVAVDEHSGQVVDTSLSMAGPTADLRLLEHAALMTRLPPGVRALGDLAYVGIAALGCGAAPRRKPRSQARPPDDVAYNTAFSRRRIVVEHTLARFRHFQSLAQPDRHHRRHAMRVAAVAGLVNRQMVSRLPH